jgi:predicted Fe-S protein YdhL (DUF1289 family)
MSKTKAKSPCIDICKIDKDSGLCKGCLRSKQEIKDWKKLPKSERRAIIEAIPLRKAQSKAKAA